MNLGGWAGVLLEAAGHSTYAMVPATEPLRSYESRYGFLIKFAVQLYGNG